MYEIKPPKFIGQYPEGIALAKARQKGMEGYAARVVQVAAHTFNVLVIGKQDSVLPPGIAHERPKVEVIYLEKAKGLS